MGELKDFFLLGLRGDRDIRVKGFVFSIGVRRGGVRGGIGWSCSPQARVQGGDMPGNVWRVTTKVILYKESLDLLLRLPRIRIGVDLKRFEGSKVQGLLDGVDE